MEHSVFDIHRLEHTGSYPAFVVVIYVEFPFVGVLVIGNAVVLFVIILYKILYLLLNEGEGSKYV